MMEEQWLAYLRENNPELYEQAVSSVKWAAEWRDKELAAANARVAELEQSQKMNEEHQEVYRQAIEVGGKFRKQNQTATWEERHAILKPRYMARSQEENVADLLSTIVISENRAREREIYRERLCAVKDELDGAKVRLSRIQQRAEQAEAKLNETYTDENGTVWTVPTAWAYYAVCKANDKNREAKEQAEAQCAAMRAVIEYLSMRYSLCVRILPNGAWQVETHDRATCYVAPEEKP